MPRDAERVSFLSFYFFRALALEKALFISALRRPISRAKARFTDAPPGELNVRRNSKCK
jgi:hypothetical protein